MELIDYVRLLRRRWAYLVVALLSGIAGGFLVAHQKTPTYTSTLRLFVNAPTAVQANGLIDTLSQVADSGPVVQRALSTAPGAGSVTVNATGNGTASVLSIVATSKVPDQAFHVAAAYATVLPSAYEELNQGMGAVSGVSLRILDQTAATATPLHKSRTIAVGALLGLAVGLAMALIRESLDLTVRDTRELERLFEREVIGSVPGDRASGVVTVTRPASARAEAYRRIRAQLKLTATGMPLRSVLTTSAVSGEGKTTTALNLAAAAAYAGERVIVVDGDLRRPAVSLATGVEDGPGLTDVLQGRVPLAEALQHWGPVTLLTAGSAVRNPVELLGGPTLRAVLAELSTQYGLVIVDSPAVLPIADAELLAAACDGVLMITRLGSTQRASVERALQELDRVGNVVVGMLANFAGGGDPLPRARRRRDIPSPTRAPAPDPWISVSPADIMSSAPEESTSTGGAHRAPPVPLPPGNNEAVREASGADSWIAEEGATDSWGWGRQA